MKIRKFSAAALVAIATVVLSGACSESDSGEPTLSISQPAAGAAVSVPFTVQFASSVPLGDEATGLHHVHLYFDDHSDDYLIVESTSVQVTDAPPGQHVMHLSLRNANHSPAGAEIQMAVTVNGGSQSPAPRQSDTGGGGYDYCWLSSGATTGVPAGFMRVCTSRC
jgi:hypothetical protein